MRPSLVAASRPLRILHLYRRFHPADTGDGICFTWLTARCCAFFRDELGVIFSSPADPHRRLSVLPATLPVVGGAQP